MAADVDTAHLALNHAGAQLPLDRAGVRLKRAREAAGTTLAQVAAATKIPERLLMAIEESRFSVLPSRIYALGFSRSYARMVGLDEAEIVKEVRAEIDSTTPGGDIPTAQAFTPGDPARVPELRLAMLAALGAVLVILAGLVFWHSAYNPAGSLPSILPADAPTSGAKAGVAAVSAAPVAAPLAARAPAGGAVTLSALSAGIWVKVYETSGKVLFEQAMTQGQVFTVPADAQAPLIWTGRPDALAIAVAGKPVAKLAETQRIIKDVPISAAALLARAPAPAGTTPAAATAKASPAAQ
ncbi:MAG: helix-turn-helix domain-containing protein [Pseudomonadota bacterium]|nr:helix-turn-helix domain-containing protein [Pseudomonadota bacterium]